MKGVPSYQAEMLYMMCVTYMLDTELPVEDCKEELTRYVGPPFTSDYYYRPNETLQKHVEMTRALITTAENNCVDNNVYFEPRYWHSPKYEWLLYFEENAVGKMWHSSTLASLGSIIDRRCEVLEKRERVLEALPSVTY